MNLKETNGKLLLNGKEIPNTLNECFSERGMEIPDEWMILCPMCLNMQGSGNLEKLLPHGRIVTIDDVNRLVIRFIESLTKRCGFPVSNMVDRNGNPWVPASPPTA